MRTNVLSGWVVHALMASRTRKTKPKADELHDLLTAVLTRLSAKEKAPKRRSFIPAPPDLDEQSFDRLYTVLGEVCESPDLFSCILQVWLDYHGIRWPKGVFVSDMMSLGSGRTPSSDLGWRANNIYVPRTFGWHKVAKKLLPDEYKQNPNRAANKVRRAAQNSNPKRTSPLESAVRVLGLTLLGVPEGICSASERDEYDHGK